MISFSIDRSKCVQLVPVENCLLNSFRTTVEQFNQIIVCCIDITKKLTGTFFNPPPFEKLFVPSTDVQLHLNRRLEEKYQAHHFKCDLSGNICNSKNKLNIHVRNYRDNLKSVNVEIYRTFWE